MGFDLKDITELLPFIADNLSKCIYIIAVSSFLGFCLGKFISKANTKNKKQLMDDIERLTNDNSQLKSIIAAKPSQHGDASPLMSLKNLEELLNSTTGSVELSALIELKYKQNKSENQHGR